MRAGPGRSLSQTQAMMAPNRGTVALRMPDRPVLIEVTAYANNTKGKAELSMPMNNTGTALRRNESDCPLNHNTGISTSAPITTRTPAVAMNPNSAPPRRMNRKDEPQMAARARYSRAMNLGAMQWVRVGQRAGRRIPV